MMCETTVTLRPGQRLHFNSNLTLTFLWADDQEAVFVAQRRPPGGVAPSPTDAPRGLHRPETPRPDEVNVCSAIGGGLPAAARG
jgi:hypothetical protein